MAAMLASRVKRRIEGAAGGMEGKGLDPSAQFARSEPGLEAGR
jgi:hypothetical protein